MSIRPSVIGRLPPISQFEDLMSADLSLLFRGSGNREELAMDPLSVEL
jgi:hypothetical protein